MTLHECVHLAEHRMLCDQPPSSQEDGQEPLVTQEQGGYGHHLHPAWSSSSSRRCGRFSPNICLLSSGTKTCSRKVRSRHSSETRSSAGMTWSATVCCQARWAGEARSHTEAARLNWPARCSTSWRGLGYFYYVRHLYKLYKLCTAKTFLSLTQKQVEKSLPL